ncbi:hypothetical protein HY409_03855 [Candidatus Gottesmanbacteria bacterium]|nr:hypothetical protein [Candidatus Gottesmanbacteria bacterium]
MITLLHGDNIEASRKELTKLKEEAKGKEVRQIDGRLIDEGSLIQALESQSLFGGDTLVIIENLFSKLGRQQKRIVQLASILVSSQGATDIIVWEGKEVGATVIKSLGTRVNAQEFKVPVVIFQFLDSLRLQNSRSLLSLFSQATHHDAPELIFAMIVRRMRQLIMLKDNVIPEGLQGWQADRLTSQVKSFTMEKLVFMYKKLLDIEYSIKSGSSPFTLTQHIELWLTDF